MSKNEGQMIAMIEAILFMYGKDVSFARIAELVEGTEDAVKEQVLKLQEIYASRDGGLQIMIKDDHVQMVTHPAVADMIEQITKKEIEGPLTPVAMEVLSIIAYRGPIGKVDIEAIRGVNCSFTLRNLVRRGLIEHVRVDEGRRAQRYQVTMDFLRILGIATVEDLPEFIELSTDKRIDAILYSEQSGTQEA
ncbi:MAG: SMC-Scp complex subunit ScpB [Parcubacteria group bacterium]|jgi:segregation and condensation protein B